MFTGQPWPDQSQCCGMGTSSHVSANPTQVDHTEAHGARHNNTRRVSFANEAAAQLRLIWSEVQNAAQTA